MHTSCPEVQTQALQHVHRSDLHPGDYVLVKTRNSLYEIRVLGDGRYQVSGGWFNRNRATAAPTTIEGFSRRGHPVSRSDLVAAVGGSLVFGNRLRTSPIQEICLVSSNLVPSKQNERADHRRTDYRRTDHRRAVQQKQATL